MKELFLIFSTIGGFFSLMCAVSFGTVSWVCNDYATQTGKETKSSYGTCYIKHENEWFVWEEYKLRNITAGAK